MAQESNPRATLSKCSSAGPTLRRVRRSFAKFAAKDWRRVESIRDCQYPVFASKEKVLNRSRFGNCHITRPPYCPIRISSVVTPSKEYSIWL